LLTRTHFLSIFISLTASHNIHRLAWDPYPHRAILSLSIEKTNKQAAKKNRK
jgi:hypothetical protein